MREKRFCPYCGHQLTSRVIEKRNRLFCTSCRSPYYENPIPATAAVFFNEKQEVLLVKRSVEPKIGQWCLPGGFVELDETPQQCCLRELKEETNLTGLINRMLGVYLSENPVYKSVLVIGFLLSQVKGQIRPGDDSDEVRFSSLSRLPPIAFKSHLKLIDDGSRVYRNHHSKSVSKTFNPHFGAYVISSHNHIEIINEACRAGARIVQYRDKNSDKKKLMDNAKRIREITNRYDSLFVVNDHLDVAMISGADGVHLGQDDLTIEEVRQVAPPDFIVGLSTHSLMQAIRAERQGADYIGIGPVFATPTKHDYVPIGVSVVEKVLRAVSIPVVAIGGLNLGNISEVKKIGVKNVAMVREFQQNTAEVVRQINRKFL